MTFELSLLATAKAVPELRHHLRALDFEVRLCATELLTNVIDHLGEGTPVTVRVTGTDLGHTRIEVTDPDPRALPTLLSASETAESGRGLTLVDVLARRWGVEQGADRKTVWCELAESGRQSVTQSEKAVRAPMRDRD
ncbi:ATP-binding protein [Streptomyces cellulosae]|uniref:ATP-binding protein n=1 Tax=Streptomyces cellulosae TaxID=1968 RepID=A0ABW7Y1P7_STRCE